jgi:hypothetical protein
MEAKFRNKTSSSRIPRNGTFISIFSYDDIIITEMDNKSKKNHCGHIINACIYSTYTLKKDSFLWLFNIIKTKKSLISALLHLPAFFRESRPIRRTISIIKMLIFVLQVLDLKTEMDYTARLFFGYKVFGEKYC